MTNESYTNDLDTLSQWVGRSEQHAEVISTSWCRKMEQTLGREAVLVDGDVLPPLWHFITHLGSVPLAELDRDGHPRRGAFLPPVALPRRMWASGRIEFDGDLRLGEEVTKTSTIDNVEMKTGRTGRLCFVTVRHELAAGGVVRIREVQDLVYRDDPVAGAAQRDPRPAPNDAEIELTVTPTEVMMFRYSALTFNAHRIHYDRGYARDVEGYRGLVVHGPLTATMLAEMAEVETGQKLVSFSFRGLSPLFDNEALIMGAKRNNVGMDLWASGPQGQLAMQAEAIFVTGA